MPVDPSLRASNLSLRIFLFKFPVPMTWMPVIRLPTASPKCKTASDPWVPRAVIGSTLAARLRPTGQSLGSSHSLLR
jgi:hypothetical protein